MKKCISFHRLNFKTYIQFGCKAYQRTLKKQFLLKKKKKYNSRRLGAFNERHRGRRNRFH